MPSNILQWNPAGSNQENDAQYAADTLRSGGATTDAILPSPTANKGFYQWSSVCAALAQALSNKGYTVSDANYAALVAVMANIRTNADVLPGLVTVAYSATPAFNAALSAGFDITLTGNVTSSTITGQFFGELIAFVIVQDATGGRTFAWPSNVYGAGAIGLAPNAISVQLFLTRADLTIHAAAPMSINGISGPFVYSVTTNGNVPSGYSQVAEMCNTSGGSFTRTLYTPVGNAGATVIIKKLASDTSTNTITVATAAGLIENASTVLITTAGTSLTFLSDGTNWNII